MTELAERRFADACDCLKWAGMAAMSFMTFAQILFHPSDPWIWAAAIAGALYGGSNFRRYEELR